MSQRILEGVWQVGGEGFTNPADAAIYLLRAGDEAALVDAGCGKGHERLKRHIEKCLGPDARLKYLLLTHSHYDHTGGAAAVRDEFGCEIVAHELDAVYLEEGNSQVTAASWYGHTLEPFTVDVKLSRVESVIHIGDSEIKAIHTPGHSPGSVVYTMRVGDKLALFGQDVHGPIHPGLLSDERLYQASLSKLLSLDADYLLEGHYGVFKGKKDVRRFIQSFVR